MTEKQADKLIRSFDTPESFADFCFPTADTTNTRLDFFKAIKWNEGYHYCCSNYNYAKQTGFKCIKVWSENYHSFKAYYPS